MGRIATGLRGANHILLCLRYGIGDVVMELPALDALRRVRPRARITALAASPADQLFAADPRIDELVILDRWGIRHRWDPGTAAMRAAIARWAADRGFDAILDVRQVPPVLQQPLWRSGVPVLDSDEAAESAALRNGAGAVAAIAAAVESGWGVRVGPDPQPRLHVPEASRRRAAALLAGSDGPPIGVAPVGSLDLKRWPPDRFAAAARRLRAACGRTILVFGSEADEDARRTLRCLRGEPGVQAALDLPLLEVAALLERTSILLTNDSGLMHMAAALGTPTVAIFGPTSIQVYRPRAAHVFGVAAPVPCRHRRADSMNPSDCWYRGHCLLGLGTCIRSVEAESVARLAARVETRFRQAGSRRGEPAAKRAVRSG